MKSKECFLLTKIFGNGVRVKVLEILLDQALNKEEGWLNLSEIAKITKISTSSSKRIVDKLLEEEVIELKPIQTHAMYPEKEVRINLDEKIIKELVFFYRKVKGFL